jgi:LysR family transcriptional regulator, glycine cleavage system transcriptional activator
MPHELPPLNALRAFEAVARHENMTRAAEELRVAQSAISRHIQNLEQDLGQKLFVRERGGLSLTTSGVELYGAVSSSWAMLEGITHALRARPNQPTDLRIDTQVTLSSTWLIPRLPRFCARHPHITPKLIIGDGPLAFEKNQADIAVRLAPNLSGAFGAGILHEVLFPDRRVLVARNEDADMDPRELLRNRPLLQHSSAPNHWPIFLERYGVRDVDPDGGPSFEHAFMLVAAVRAGLGIAVAPEPAVEEFCASGELCQFRDEALQTDQAYFVFYPKQKEFHPAVKVFRDWLLDEANVSRYAAGSVPECAHHVQNQV